jgi:hypothetical protein
MFKNRSQHNKRKTDDIKSVLACTQVNVEAHEQHVKLERSRTER